MTEASAAEEFAELALGLHDMPVEQTVERVLEFALKALNCAYAGVNLIHSKGQLETFAATHPLIAELDQSQLECGQGPDLELIPDRHGVLIHDMEEDDRWPQWSPCVAASGIRSMLGTRLYTGKGTIGSLNFYDPEPNRFDDADVDVAHLLARHAAVAIESARGAEHLWKAIDARNLIGQAQGIMMERFGIDADQAFAVLRRYSQDNNLRLHAVAERLIATRTLPS